MWNHRNEIPAIKFAISRINTTGIAKICAIIVGKTGIHDTAHTAKPPTITNAISGITTRFAINPPNVNILKKYAAKNVVTIDEAADKAILSGKYLCIFTRVLADSCRLFCCKNSLNGW